MVMNVEVKCYTERQVVIASDAFIKCQYSLYIPVGFVKAYATIILMS